MPMYACVLMCVCVCVCLCLHSCVFDISEHISTILNSHITAVKLFASINTHQDASVLSSISANTGSVYEWSGQRDPPAVRPPFGLLPQHTG